MLHSRRFAERQLLVNEHYGFDSKHYRIKGTKALEAPSCAKIIVFAMQSKSNSKLESSSCNANLHLQIQPSINKVYSHGQVSLNVVDSEFRLLTACHA